MEILGLIVILWVLFPLIVMLFVGIFQNIVSIGYLNGKYKNVSVFGFYKQMYSVLCGNTSGYGMDRNIKLY